MLNKLCFNLTTREFTEKQPDTDFISVEHCNDTETKVLSLTSNKEVIHLHNDIDNHDEVKAIELFNYKNTAFMKYVDFFRLDNKYYLDGVI